MNNNLNYAISSNIQDNLTDSDSTGLSDSFLKNFLGDQNLNIDFYVKLLKPFFYSKENSTPDFYDVYIKNNQKIIKIDGICGLKCEKIKATIRRKADKKFFISSENIIPILDGNITYKNFSVEIDISLLINEKTDEYEIYLESYDNLNIKKNESISTKTLIMEFRDINSFIEDKIKEDGGLLSPPTDIFHTINRDPLPFFEFNSKQNKEILLNNHIKLQTNYRQYIKNYEDNIKDVQVLERNLLNFQILTNYKSYNSQNINDCNELVRAACNNIPLDEKKNNINYFHDYNSKGLKGTNPHLRNIIIISDALRDIQNNNSEKSFFPFYNTINLKFNDESTCANLLQKYGLEFEFLKFIQYLNSIFESQGSSNTFFQNDKPTDKNFYLKNSKNQYQKIDFNFSINSFFKNFLFNTSLDQNATILTKDSYKNKIINKFKNKLYYQLVGGIAKELLTPFIQPNTSEVIKNYKDGEVVAFQIQKIKENGEILTNTFFINDTLIDEFEILDTQIKYGTRYKYKIFGYVLSNVTNKSFINRIQLTDDISILNEDNAPLAPAYNVLLDNNRKNSIILNIDNIVGERNEILIPINSLPDKNAIIKFKNDDTIKQYIVYRLDKKPNNYIDFNNGISFNASSMSIFDTLELNKDYYYTIRALDSHNRLSNPSFVTKVRIVDNDGIKFLDNIIYSSYEFADDPEKFTPWKVYDKKSIENIKLNDTKNFKRYLQVIPSNNQLLLKNLLPPEFLKFTVDDLNNFRDLEIFGEDANKIENNPIISMINKKYKIRIKSKNSGKMLDINFNYSLNDSIFKEKYKEYLRLEEERLKTEAEEKRKLAIARAKEEAEFKAEEATKKKLEAEEEAKRLKAEKERIARIEAETNQRLQDLQKQLDEALNRLRQREAALTDYQRLQAQYQDLNDRYIASQNQLKNKIEQEFVLRATITEREVEIGKLNADLREMTRQRDVAIAERNTIIGQRDTAIRERDEANKKNGQIQARIEYWYGKYSEQKSLADGYYWTIQRLESESRRAGAGREY